MALLCRRVAFGFGEIVSVIMLDSLMPDIKSYGVPRAIDTQINVYFAIFTFILLKQKYYWLPYRRRQYSIVAPAPLLQDIRPIYTAICPSFGKVRDMSVANVTV